MSTLTRWRPFDLWPLSREATDIMRRWNDEERAGFDWTPSGELIETTEGYLVKLETPGMKPEDIQVMLNGDILTLKGEKKQEEKREDEHWHVFERSYGAFQRTFALPGPVDANGVEATIENGVLEVRLIKSKESETKRVKVKAR